MREFDATVSQFAFGIGDPVSIALTEERGVVRGFRRCEDESEDMYLVEYVDNSESFQREWFREEVLAPVMSEDHAHVH